MMTTVNPSTLNVVADSPDLRDRLYEPSLAPLKPVMHPPGNLDILNQGTEGACTGFGLAATINLLYRFQNNDIQVSPWMLYAMARRYDEWAGEDYDGSSCRGAIKGWKNTGVCLSEFTKHRQSATNFAITSDIAADAKKRTLGAYFRLRPVISDFHSALNEAGVIYASARVHSGWFETQDHQGEHIIPFQHDLQGGHAFAIVGYNELGFWVQNSWGENGWGKGGLAIWLYEDWAKNHMDAWVIQLALPTPQIFNTQLVASEYRSDHVPVSKTTPRQAIQEHFIHLDDGKFSDTGKYWSNKQHAKLVIESMANEDNIKHVVLYAHGGLNSTRDSAQRIAAMKSTFLANGIYPIHFMYDTGLCEEIKDVLLGKFERAAAKSAGFSDWLDNRLEFLTASVGRALWREMKQGAASPFSTKSADGAWFLHTLQQQLLAMSKPHKLHIIGHSTGAILHANSLVQAHKLNKEIQVQSCHLLAPAATNSFFNETLKPLIENGFIKRCHIYNLSDKLELDDNVAKVYQKSLLYLVSRAFEENKPSPLLGMQKYNALIPPLSSLKFIYSNGITGERTASTTHGGFDNDPDTMNDVLKGILGRAPDTPFTEKSLRY
ncbi:C1 family peptidase [Aestuariibacter sp. AA17]|uniref:C1 family peptidase n=1 Tax=Fluctibacter corallii TaxID=2984329 RepID=A0ABT3A6K5_9ALTE|nr:C1 family peptidase [Aestuariibacter sp. AA17]MCV2884192.1 C1 family peptidase [Aestuariibacter sp. AA17]